MYHSTFASLGYKYRVNIAAFQSGMKFSCGLCISKIHGIVVLTPFRTNIPWALGAFVLELEFEIVNVLDELTEVIHFDRVDHSVALLCRTFGRKLQ
jgi:hypothetical protein